MKILFTILLLGTLTACECKSKTDTYDEELDKVQTEDILEFQKRDGVYYDG